MANVAHQIALEFTLAMARSGKVESPADVVRTFYSVLDAFELESRKREKDSSQQHR